MEQNGSESESESEKLKELSELAEKIKDYRATLPEQLKTTLPFFVEAQRPVFGVGSDPGTSGAPISGEVASDKDVLGEQTYKKITSLREKVSHNVAALPHVLTRLRECMSSIDKLDSQNTFIHPAMKRKRTS